MILFTFSSSPFSTATLSQWRNRISSQDAILLMQDACYAIHHSEILSVLADTTEKLFVLENDRVARGLPLPDTLQDIDYQAFVALTFDADTVIAL